MPRHSTFIESFIKYTVSVVISTVAVLTFLTPRTTHNALADEVKSSKSDIKNILALVCQLGVESLGKDAVRDYCATTTTRGE